MRLVATCLALIASCSQLAHATCSASSAAARIHLIELYTSEGCSSCPPADRWLSTLPVDQTRLPLAFHVDYWDSPTWRDRFADPRFTQRQNALAAYSNSSVAYTPEVAFDGREWRDWGSHPLPMTITPAIGLVLRIDSTQPLRVRLETKPMVGIDTNAYVAYFALSENALSSAVLGGENHGVELHHDHVVRAFVGPMKLAAAQATIEVPAEVRREHASVVAFVQQAQNGEVAGAVALSLQQCGAAAGG